MTRLVAASVYQYAFYSGVGRAGEIIRLAVPNMQGITGV
jgi:hypothetical protein